MSELTFETSGYLPWIDLGPIRVQSYFIVVSLVLSTLPFLIVKRARSFDVSYKRALDLYIGLMIGGFLGARLFHVFWEERDYYFQDPFRIFDFLQGGFVWYGGLIGGLATISVILFLKRDDASYKQVSLWLLPWLDFFAPIAAVGYGLGRLACVVTGCCYGRVCHLHEYIFRFPTQGFAVIFELAVAYFLCRAENRRWQRGRNAGQIFFLWIVLHGFGRLIMEFMRNDPRGPDLAGLSIASILSLILIVAGISQLKTVNWSVLWSGFLRKSRKSP
jgi:phosphatidylglycerol:prolipoprotein diacylglycerol transferase